MENRSELERIYIGGLDPPRLTASEVWNRLRSHGIPSLNLSSVDLLKDSKPFFYVNATAKPRTSERAEMTTRTRTRTRTKRMTDYIPTDGIKSSVSVDSEWEEEKEKEEKEEEEENVSSSAWKLISKHYHNVKWKGCRLIVQRAKPHFLERLEEERRQRRRILQSRPSFCEVGDSVRPTLTDTSPLTTNATNATNATMTQQRRRRRRTRHWRIRKRYGMEAQHVDTQPLEIKSWDELTEAIAKMKEKRNRKRKAENTDETNEGGVRLSKKQRHQQFIKDAFWNRSIHWRFTALPSSSNNKKEYPDEESSESSESSGTPRAEKASSSSSNTSSHHDHREDEDDQDDDDDDDEDHQDDDDEDHQDDDDSFDGSDYQKPEKRNKKNSAYVWSDEESRNSEGSVPDGVLKNKNKKQNDDNDNDGKDDDNDDDGNDDIASSESSLSAEWDQSTNERRKPIIQTEIRTYENGGTTVKGMDFKKTKDHSGTKDVRSSKKHSSTEHFSGANDQEEEDGDEGKATHDDKNDKDENDKDDRCDEENLRLVNDVRSNLNILSQLFPGMSTTPEKMPLGLGDEEKEDDENDEESSRQPKKGMGAAVESSHLIAAAGAAAAANDSRGRHVLMQRYDPSKADALQFELQPSNSAAVSAADKDSCKKKSYEEEDDDHSQHPQGDSSAREGSDESGLRRKNLYEEKKLAAIFREARGEEDPVDAHRGDEPTRMTTTIKGVDSAAEAALDGGTFAFNFDLGPAQKVGPISLTRFAPKESGCGGFQFDFTVHLGGREETTTTTTTTTVGKEQPPETKGSRDRGHHHLSTQHAARDGTTESKITEGTLESTPRRRRTNLMPVAVPFFPDAVLDQYAEAFFSTNEGDFIASDPHGFLKDEQIKTNWNRERTKLTLDWKRKRKHAISQMQRRMKHR